MNKLNFVSCVGWVRRGVAREIPNRLSLSKEEMEAKCEEHQQKLKEFNKNHMETEGDTDQEIIDRYNLNDYDNDDENDNFLAVSNDIIDEHDPYVDRIRIYSDEEEEADDFRIKPTDNLLLCGHVEEDSVALEVRVFNSEDDPYVHHEIYLEAYPLCFEWLDFKSSNEKGNFVAVGDMKPNINIWDLDLVDSLQPFAVLTGHQKSVLDLSWNSIVSNILASGSADHKCLIWDLETHQNVKQIDSFESLVQSIQFHPEESNWLLAGDSDGLIRLFDIQDSSSFKKYKMSSDEIEKVVWSLNNPSEFLCATSTGLLFANDCRMENQKLFSSKIHQEMIIGVEFSCAYSSNNILLTASSDQTVKVWQLSKTNQLKLIETIKPNIGTLLSLAANPNLPYVFAISGDNISQNFKILNLDKELKSMTDKY